jgi:hypothetical protein
MQQRWIWGGVILFFVLFSLVPMFYEISRAGDLHPDRYFELVHNFYTDYNFYLSRIRQGREGAWTVHEKYTSEPHEGSYIQIMYLLMGRVSEWVRVPWPNSGDTYHVARIVLAATLLFVMSYAAKSAFKRFRWRIIAFLLAVTAASWPILVYHANEWRFGGYMPWWTIMDSLIRITFVPHMLAGQALIIFLLLALSDTGTMHRPGNWIFLGLLAFVLGVIFPPGLLFVFAAYGIFALFDGLSPAKLIGPAIVVLISSPSLLYLSLALRVYPWKRLVDFAMLHPQPFQLWDYILAVGPLLLLGVIGGIWAIWKREKRFYIFVAWVLAWAALIIAFGYIPQESPLRFTEMMPQVPLAILTVYLLSNLSNLGNLWRKTIITLSALFILMGIAQMYSYWRWQKEFLDQKILATQPLVPTGSTVMYPLKDMVGTMIWIQDHTSRDTVILSETTAGNYMPVYSGNTVYVGHAGTVNTEQKEQIVNAFFGGRMNSARAKDFLTANNLHYIFFGPQESGDGGLSDLSSAYPFLKQTYQQGFFRIYQW